MKILQDLQNITENPEWSIERCEEEAKRFKRSCNYQCIEYYEKNSHKGYLFDFCFNDKLIEFNGDYWHANPMFYEPKSFIKAKNKRAENIWEYDYYQNRETVINKCIEFLNS